MEAQINILPTYRHVGRFKGFLFLSAMLIIIGLLAFTQYLIGRLRAEARKSLTQNIEHYSFLLENADPARAFEEIRKIEVPIILADQDGNPKFWKNIDITQEDSTAESREKLKRMMLRMDRVVKPIPLKYSPKKIDYFHYGDSRLVVLLRMLPYMGIAGAGLFILIGYVGFRHIKDSEQRMVWVGMARETAHQLGTPLTSLLGWMELLKSGEANEGIYQEMDKDIARLEQITARFSQIGSEVKLQSADLIPIVKGSINYYRRRIPQSGKRVEIVENFSEPVITKINPYLIGWVVENLIRNSIDAISESAGVITISVKQEHEHAFIDIADTGCGIEYSNRRNVFRPGFTTKKRGWGVGLSLARRIVEDYHGGRLFIKESHPGEGTVMRVSLPMK